MLDTKNDTVKGSRKSGLSRGILHVALVILFLAVVALASDTHDDSDKKENYEKNTKRCGLKPLPLTYRSIATCSRSDVIYYSIKNCVTLYSCVTVTMCWMGKRIPFIEYMKLACNEHSTEFTNFTGTYYPKLGFFITALNGVTATGDNYWSFIDAGTGKLLPLGVSSYIPQPGEHVAFNMTVCPPRGTCT